MGVTVAKELQTKRSGSGSCCGEMESDTTSKKLNDDVVVFMSKRSETEAPRYTARLKTYVDIQRKRRRAAVAQRQGEERHKSATRPKSETKDKNNKSGDEKSFSRSRTEVPQEGCCPKKRRPSCCRRRRRRTSCKRRRKRSCRRRRRRSRCRKRRRRSCRRKRRSCRRKRRC